MNAAPRILIAEDDGFVRELLRMVFGGRPYSLTAVSDGRQALDAYAADPFDLVITDIRMPVMGGYALLNALKTGYPGTKVIMMSSENLDEEILRDLGACAFLRKPFELETIRKLVAATLGNASPRFPAGMRLRTAAGERAGYREQSGTGC